MERKWLIWYKTWLSSVTSWTMIDMSMNSYLIHRWISQNSVADKETTLAFLHRNRSKRNSMLIKRAEGWLLHTWLVQHCRHFSLGELFSIITRYPGTQGTSVATSGSSFMVPLLMATPGPEVASAEGTPLLDIWETGDEHWDPQTASTRKPQLYSST